LSIVENKKKNFPGLRRSQFLLAPTLRYIERFGRPLLELDIPAAKNTSISKIISNPGFKTSILLYRQFLIFFCKKVEKYIYLIYNIT